MKIRLDSRELNSEGGHGLEISVVGFQGDQGAEPSQVFIEFYEGKLAVHVWDGSSEDAKSFIIRQIL